MKTPEQRARHCEYQRKYVERNRARINAAVSAAYAANPEHFKRRQAKRRAVTKPWQRRSERAAKFAFRSNCRAAVFGATGRLSATDVRKLDGPCVYCGGGAMGWDHVVPLAKGGANSIENLVSCCAPCNKHKWNRTPAEAGMRFLQVAS